jgi:hypothetical protein
LKDEERAGYEEITYYRVFRSLSEPTYLLRFYFIRLTEIELIICFIVLTAAMAAIEALGAKEAFWFSFFPVDPGGYLGAALMTALFFSLLHELRPHGNTLQVLRGLLLPKHLASRPDKYWIPVDGKIYLGEGSFKRRRDSG